MGSRFVIWMTVAFVAALGLLGGVGYAIARMWVAQPRELHRNPAFEFELANGWWCVKDGTEDVCHPAGTKPFPAVAVIAVKHRNTQDTLDAYQAHLSKPQANSAKSTDAVRSVVRSVKRQAIGGRTWVVAAHEGSEIANFVTNYFATTTPHIGILVTLSVHKDQEQRFTNEFTEMMKSLRTYQR